MMWSMGGGIYHEEGDNTSEDYGLCSSAVPGAAPLYIPIEAAGLMNVFQMSAGWFRSMAGRAGRKRWALWHGLTTTKKLSQNISAARQRLTFLIKISEVEGGIKICYTIP